MVPAVNDVVNIFVKIGAISSTHSLKIYVDILSGPFASLGSRFFSNFCTPLTSNVTSLICGAGGVRRHGIIVCKYNVILFAKCLRLFSTCCYLFAINFEYGYPSRVPLPFVLT